MAAGLRNSINMRTGSVCWREITPLEVVQFAFHGKLPAHGFQPIFHEFAAHYWCANTPVNRAIQMRWLDYLRRSALLLTTDDFAGDDSAQHAARFDPELIALSAELLGIESCLRPFAEGIATFVEFNYYPPPKRAGQIVPYLTQIAVLLAQMNADASGDQRPGVGSLMRAHEALKACRLDKCTVRRKGDLLCHPIGNGGLEECYLLGYALIKSIYDKIRATYDRLDLEDIVSFLIFHIYWDWRIVDLLVTNEHVRPEAVMSLVASTIRGLFEDDLLERYDAWDKWQMDLLASGQWETGRDNEMPFHGLSTEQIQSIKRRGGLRPRSAPTQSSRRIECPPEHSPDDARLLCAVCRRSLGGNQESHAGAPVRRYRARSRALCGTGSEGADVPPNH